MQMSDNIKHINIIMYVIICAVIGKFIPVARR
jgi:hypothetical protein